MKFFADIMGRADRFSSKKVWFNLSCLIASGCLCYITYRNDMDDFYYIVLYSIYLTCLGSFEIIPKILAMVLEFKTGKPSNIDTTLTTTKTTTEKIKCK